MARENSNAIGINEKKVGEDENPVGIYIHIPFCIRKCPYCDFYSITNLDLIPNYVRALVKEIGNTRPMPFFVDTIYFGGGTPSLLAPPQIQSILEAVYKKFKIDPRPEVTLEVNPGSIRSKHLIDFIHSGVNRINMGVQSFQDKNLSFLGRIHTSEQARQSLLNARKAGFNNIGLDLIYGLPGQERAQWEKDLAQAIDFGPEHLSCYMLTMEQGTPLYKNYQLKMFTPLSEDKLKDFFETAMDILGNCGYFHYEISNFARISGPEQNRISSAAFQSRHNRKYWTGAPYLGFGPGAHSFISPVRYWNLPSVAGYMEALNKKRLPVEEKEILTREQEMMEFIYLGLRTAEGIDTKKFDQKFNADFKKMSADVLEALLSHQYLVLSGHHIRMSRMGMVLLDGIAGKLIEAIVP